MKIRLAKHSDFDQMIKIKMDCVTKMHQTGQNLQYVISEDSYPNRKDFIYRIRFENLYVAEDNDNVVGFYNLETKDENEFVNLGYSNTNTIHMLFVDPNAQGKGVATLMAKHAIEQAKINKVKYVTIDTHPTNKPTINLSKKLGAKFIGELSWDKPLTDISIRYAYAIEL